MGAVTRSVALAASAIEVWERAVTFAGVNDEFAPLLRMTRPRGAATLLAAEPGAAAKAPPRTNDAVAGDDTVAAPPDVAAASDAAPNAPSIRP